MQPVGHDFEALAVFKEYCDKKDVYYVYKINDRRGNPDKPSFVFKSSKKKAEIAINIVVLLLLYSIMVLHEVFIGYNILGKL